MRGGEYLEIYLKKKKKKGRAHQKIKPELKPEQAYLMNKCA